MRLEFSRLAVNSAIDRFSEFSRAHSCFAIVSCTAPKARNAIAWGNAPGKDLRYKERQRRQMEIFLSASKPAWCLTMSHFQCSDVTAIHLGRCPRLLHFAPLALKSFQFIHHRFRHQRYVVETYARRIFDRT